VKDLRVCLENYPVPMLRAIAYSQGIKTKNETKSELIDRIMDHVLRPEIIAMNLAMLTVEERAALDRVIAAGGKIAVHGLAREFGEVRRLGAGRLERLKPWIKPQTPTERLYYLGMIYLGFAAIDDYRGQVFFIPPEILSQLPAVSAPPPQFEVRILADPPTQVFPANQMVVYDAFVLLCAMQRNHAAGPHESGENLSPHLPFSPGMMAFLKDRLSVSAVPGLPAAEESRRLTFLLRLIEKMGLVKESDGSYWQLDLGAVRDWLELPLDKRLLAMQTAWRNDRRWNELWHVPSLRPEPTGWRNDPVHARQHLLDHLARCPAGRWISLSSFIQAVKKVDSDFQRPDGDYESWYIRDAVTDQYLRGFETWDQVEGALIAHVIACPAHRLGIVDVGFAATDEHQTRPIAFRITDAGNSFLAGPGTEISSPKQQSLPFVVHDDLSVDVPSQSSWWNRLHLERLASFRELHDDLSAHYVLTADDLTRQLEQGAKLERIIRFLQRATGGTVPEAVVEQMRSWGNRFGQVVLGRQLVLQTASADVLQHLQQDPEVAKCFAKVVGPQTVLIHPQSQQALIAALRKAGHVPKIESDEFYNSLERK